MDNIKRNQLKLFCIWLAVTLPSLFVAYTYFPSRELDWVNISILCTILFLTMLLPLRIQDVDIPLDKWIIITVFLQYGVWAELVFMQLAILILIVAGKSTTSKIDRFFSNSLIFLITSIASGFIFHIAGGELGSLNFLSVALYGLLYAAFYTVFNNVLLKFYFYIQGRSYSLIGEGAVGDYVVTIVLLPMAIAVYFLHEYVGNKSLILLAIPLVIILLVAKNYIKSNELNEKLAFAGEIGHELTNQLGFDEVVETFIIKSKDVIPYENAYVIDLKKEKKMHLLLGYQNSVILRQSDLVKVRTMFCTEDGLDKDVTKIYNKQSELEALRAIQFSKTVESVMIVPVKRDHRTEGFLLFTSSRKNVFQPLDIQIMDILSGYFMISLDKAIYFEETINSSERCGLTNLYNFNFLEKRLEEEVIQFYTGKIENLSLILLDIDHFKKVNDIYGHESGNTVLLELANLLQIHTSEHEIIARYGGEEFVVVMPNRTKDEASELAERLRKEVEEALFTIVPDLSEENTPIDIKITISLGVASIPEDANSVQELLRNADRALYIGGKQAGRNKVGIYSEVANIIY